MREVARMMGIARSTVRDMIVRFERSGENTGNKRGH
jgi:transposase